MGEHTTSTSAASAAQIATSALALAVAAGEQSTEGFETASGVSADLGVREGGTLPSATTCVQWVTSPRTTSSSIASA